MAKPVLVDIAAGIEAWDALVSNDMAILRDNPMPVKEYTTVAGLPAASSFDRCTAFANDTNQGWRFGFSDGTIWRFFGDSDHATYGAAPARTGRSRYSGNESHLKFRNAAGTPDTADLDLLKTDASDRVILGNKDSQQVIPSGGSTSLADVVGCIHKNTTAVGNVGTGEDDLMTHGLSADTLKRNGIGVRIRAWGKTANNANAKTLKVYFGTQLILTVSLTVSQAGFWVVEAEVYRTGSNTQDWVTELHETPGTLSDIEQGTAIQTDTATITIKLTGDATSDNDIVQEGMRIDLIPG